ncbi:hypothetical protein GCM10022245_39540 [Streptomyces mayteni]
MLRATLGAAHESRPFDAGRRSESPALPSGAMLTQRRAVDFGRVCSARCRG